jgi:hypothetical protein
MPAISLDTADATQLAELLIAGASRQAAPLTALAAFEGTVATFAERADI